MQPITANLSNTHRNLYYQQAKVSLFQNDILDPNLFDSQFIDLIITSPPYNLAIDYKSNNDQLSYEKYLEFSRSWMNNCYQWSKNQTRFLLNIPLDKNKGGAKAVGADLTKIAQNIGWNYHATIVWNEGNISRRTAWGSWLSASAPYVIAPVELIVILYKGEWKKTTGTKKSDITKQEFIDWTNGLWVFKGESKKKIGHPAPFPKELPYRAIKLFSYVDDLVFDPFCGSATTLVVAANTNRRSIGVELELSYCELAKRRIINETNCLS